MKNLNPLDRARAAFQKAVTKATVQAREHAVLGWQKSASEVVIAVPGRKNYAYVTKSDRSVTVALNRANVPRQAFLPVWIVLENDSYVIVARDNSDAAALVNVPDNPYGSAPHPIDAHTDYAGGAEENYQVLTWFNGNWLNAFADWNNLVNRPNTFPPDPHPLGSHSDVNTADEENHQFLMWLDGQWTNAVVDWDYLENVPATFPPEAHAASHYAGGDDPFSTTTPAPDGVPQAYGDGKIDGGWIDVSDLREDIEDFVAAQFVGNTGIIDAIYNDSTGAITLILDVSTADRILYSTGADAWAETPLTSFARTLLDDSDAATMRTTLGLVIGTNVQAQDAELQAIAGLTSAADRLPYFTGSGTASLATFTSFARTLLDDADAATARATLGIAAYDQETVEDVVGAMVSGNTETGIAVTYDDTGGKLDFVLGTHNHQSGGVGGQLDHGLALTGLGDNDHPQYVLKAGDTVTGQLLLQTTSVAQMMLLQRYGNNSQATSLEFHKSRNAAVNGHTIVNNLDDLGFVSFRGSDGTNFIAAARVWAEVFGTPATGAIPTRLMFDTMTAGGALTNALTLNPDQAAIFSGIVGIGITPTTGRLEVVEPTLGNAVLILQSVATNDDPTEITTQHRVATTNATVTTLATFSIPTNRTSMLFIRGVARRTGGSAGAAGDSAAYNGLVAAKNVSGTVSFVSTPVIQVWEDQAAWDMAADISGTDVRIRVTGAANNNITWHATIREYPVSS